MPTIRNCALVLALLFCLTGCAATIHDYTTTQYLHDSFSDDMLQNGGLALLPITAGLGQEGYRRPLGDYMNMNLENAVPGGRILTWQAAMDSLNSAGVVTNYEEMISGYRQTSIINREKVKGLKASLGVSTPVQNNFLTEV